MGRFYVGITQEVQPKSVWYSAKIAVEASTYEEAVGKAKQLSQKELESLGQGWELETDSADAIYGTIEIQE